MLDRRRLGLRATKAAADVRVARVLACADMGDRRDMGVARPTAPWPGGPRRRRPTFASPEYSVAPTWATAAKWALHAQPAHGPIAREPQRRGSFVQSTPTIMLLLS